MLFVYIQCDEFIDKYGDEIIELIVKNADPDTICSLIRLCTSSYATVQLKDTGVFVYLCIYVCIYVCVCVYQSVSVLVCIGLCLYLCVCVSVSVQSPYSTVITQ